MGNLSKDGLPTQVRYARFVSEYLKDYNGTQAYLRAFPGTANPTARAVSSKWLTKNETVMAMVERQSANRLKLNEITAERVIMEMARIGLVNPQDAVTAIKVPGNDGADFSVEVPKLISQMPEDVARAIKEIEFDGKGGIKLKLHDKVGALRELAKITSAGPQRSLSALKGRASLVAPDDMLDAEIEAALAELEGSPEDGSEVIDMDDDGEPMLEDDADYDDE